jgi:signal transduction histidine kinase
MPRGGLIRVRSQVEPSAVVIRVEDEGGGIPPEALGRIFDPFFTTKGGSGSGLGLTLARNVVTQVGGAIRAYNRPTGGACFELRFQRADRAASRARARQPAAAARVQKSTMDRQ